jgi:hypothetical protein
MTATLSSAGYAGVSVQVPAVTTISDGSNSGAGSKSSSSAGDGNVPLIAGAAAGGVVLIGGIVALVLCLQMKKRTGGDSSPAGVVSYPATDASRYDPNCALTQDDARHAAAPPAASDRGVSDIAPSPPMLDILPVHTGTLPVQTLPVSTLPVHAPPVSALPAGPAEDPVVALGDLESEADSDGRSAVSMRLDDIRLGMTYEYAEGSERSSIDVFAFRDETTTVNNLVAKNLGHVATEDDIPAATATEHDKGGGEGDDEEDQKLRHVFRSPREDF